MSYSASIVDVRQQPKLIDSVQSIFSRIIDCSIDDSDVNKSFFELGGTSLKILQAVALLKQEISDKIDVHFFLKHLSIANLVYAITNDSSFFE